MASSLVFEGNIRKKANMLSKLSVRIESFRVWWNFDMK